MAKRGRKPGNPGVCSGCFAVGHYIQTCPLAAPYMDTPTSRAVADVERGMTQTAAALKHGVRQGGVSTAIMRRRLSRGAP